MVRKQAKKKASQSRLNMRSSRMTNADIVRAIMRLEAAVDRGQRYMLTPSQRRMLAPSQAAAVATARGFGTTRRFGGMQSLRRSVYGNPVRPLGPSPLQKAAAATKIQALYRGHLTRRSLAMSRALDKKNN